jgi:hypothetical protein
MKIIVAISLFISLIHLKTYSQIDTLFNKTSIVDKEFLKVNDKYFIKKTYLSSNSGYEMFFVTSNIYSNNYDTLSRYYNNVKIGLPLEIIVVDDNIIAQFSDWSSNSGIYKSTNNGASWIKIYNQNVDKILKDNSSSSIFFIKNNQIYTSNDLGGTWSLVSNIQINNSEEYKNMFIDNQKIFWLYKNSSSSVTLNYSEDLGMTYQNYQFNINGNFGGNEKVSYNNNKIFILTNSFSFANNIFEYYFYYIDFTNLNVINVLLNGNECIDFCVKNDTIWATFNKRNLSYSNNFGNSWNELSHNNNFKSVNSKILEINNDSVLLFDITSKITYNLKNNYFDFSLANTKNEFFGIPISFSELSGRNLSTIYDFGNIQYIAKPLNKTISILEYNRVDKRINILSSALYQKVDINHQIRDFVVTDDTVFYASSDKKIYYSLDHGISWDTITHNYPVDTSGIKPLINNIIKTNNNIICLFIRDGSSKGQILGLYKYDIINGFTLVSNFPQYQYYIHYSRLHYGYDENFNNNFLYYMFANTYNCIGNCEFYPTYSTDMGNNWISISTTNIPYSLTFNEPFRIEDSIYFISNDLLYKTYDNGISFSFVSANNPTNSLIMSVNNSLITDNLASISIDIGNSWLNLYETGVLKFIKNIGEFIYFYNSRTFEIYKIHLENIDILTNISKYRFENNIKTFMIFPNPTTGQLQVPKNSTSIVITDLLNKQVFESNVNTSNELDISFLPKGMYIIKLEIDGKNIVQKIFKE